DLPRRRRVLRAARDLRTEVRDVVAAAAAEVPRPALLARRARARMDRGEQRVPPLLVRPRVDAPDLERLVADQAMARVPIALVVGRCERSPGAAGQRARVP